MRTLLEVCRVQPGSSVQGFFSLQQQRSCGSNLELSVLQPQLLLACSLCFCSLRSMSRVQTAPKETELVQPIVSTGWSCHNKQLRGRWATRRRNPRSLSAPAQSAFVKGAGSRGSSKASYGVGTPGKRLWVESCPPKFTR